ncbi:hypothetical protein HNQ88_005208 [Aureibacter tunicatorum]|uniref:Uncharacterized protein n=1 Tax=Aureibacter tunicatorum TaxID=866807 RepID=A0AAE4BUT8_9BACT|nr:hypothetical protein [Aureibacter tunicatorum]BDD07412.1 hypothetical protein AUTU_48950 [Aureibacter tunicatorum]
MYKGTKKSLSLCQGFWIFKTVIAHRWNWAQIIDLHQRGIYQKVFIDFFAKDLLEAKVCVRV